jgi:hypothetical protein
LRRSWWRRRPADQRGERFVARAAAMNAAIEEAAYRRILLSALDATLGAGAMSILLQAIAFGACTCTAASRAGSSACFLAFMYGLMPSAAPQSRRPAGATDRVRADRHRDLQKS